MNRLAADGIRQQCVRGTMACCTDSHTFTFCHPVARHVPSPQLRLRRLLRGGASIHYFDCLLGFIFRPSDHRQTGDNKRRKRILQVSGPLSQTHPRWDQSIDQGKTPSTCHYSGRLLGMAARDIKVTHGHLDKTTRPLSQANKRRSGNTR